MTPDNNGIVARANSILSELIFSELSKETYLTDRLGFSTSSYVYWVNINFIKLLHALKDTQIKNPYFVFGIEFYTKDNVSAKIRENV